MRNMVFVWADEDGNVRVTYPVWKAKKPGESDDAFLERVAKKLPKPLAIRIDQLPPTRSKRKLWQLRDGKIVEGMEDPTLSEMDKQ